MQFEHIQQKASATVPRRPITSRRASVLLRVRSLERQLEANAAALESGRSKVAGLEAALNVAWCQLCVVQLKLTTLEAEWDAYPVCFDAELQRTWELDALLGGIRSCLVCHSSLIGLRRGLLPHDVYCNLDAYLWRCSEWFATALLIFI